MITSEQIRAARILVRWEQADLAKRAGLSRATIKRLEGRPGAIKVQPQTFAALLRAFQNAGIDLIGIGSTGRY